MGSRCSKADKTKVSKGADGNTTTIPETVVVAKQRTRNAETEMTVNSHNASTSTPTAILKTVLADNAANPDDNANTIETVAVPPNLDENGNIIESESVVTSEFDPDKNPNVVKKLVKQRQVSTLAATPPTPAPPVYPNSTLYVGDLDLAVTDTLLREKFSDFGNITSILIYRDFFSPQSLGYAYIKYQNASDAKMAKDALNFSLLTGTPMRVLWSGEQYSLNRRTTKIRMKKLLVENVTFPRVWTEDILEAFSVFGSIRRHELIVTAKKLNGVAQSHLSLEFVTDTPELTSKTTGIGIEQKIILSGLSLALDVDEILEDSQGLTSPEEKLLLKDFYRCCSTVIEMTKERLNKFNNWSDSAFCPICFHLTFEIENGRTDSGIGNPD